MGPAQHRGLSHETVTGVAPRYHGWDRETRISKKDLKHG